MNGRGVNILGEEKYEQTGEPDKAGGIRPSQVTEHIERIRSSVEHLTKAVSVLADRLQPIMLVVVMEEKDEKKGRKPSEERPLVPIARALKGIEDEIGKQVKRLEDFVEYMQI